MMENLMIVFVMIIEIVVIILNLRIINLYFKKKYDNVINNAFPTASLLIIGSLPLKFIDLNNVNSYLILGVIAIGLLGMLVVTGTLVIITKSYKMKKIEDGILDADKENEKKRKKRKIMIGILLFIIVMEILYRF